MCKLTIPPAPADSRAFNPADWTWSGYGLNPADKEQVMASNRSNRAQRSRVSVNTREDDDVLYWIRELDAAKERIRSAVRMLGESAEKIADLARRED
jgi:hypothetical protein